jgi:hypothetical protein
MPEKTFSAWEKKGKGKQEGLFIAGETKEIGFSLEAVCKS